MMTWWQYLVWYHDIPTLIILYPIGSMVLLYMVTWIPSIYPSHVSIYTSTMDPMGINGYTCWSMTGTFYTILPRREDEFGMIIQWESLDQKKCGTQLWPIEIGWSRCFHIFPYHVESIILNHTHIVSYYCGWLIASKLGRPSSFSGWFDKLRSHWLVD